MNDRYALWLPLAVLASLALLSFWLDQTIQEAGARSINQKEPDSIVENFMAISTDAKGVPQYRLVATRLRHFSDNQLTLLDMPALTQIHAKNGELKITSNTANVMPDNRKVLFTGDVILRRQMADKKNMITMKTSYLETLPDKGIVTTRKPVLIEQPGMVVTANGLDLSSNTRILKLSGRVKVQYQSSRRA